MAILPKHTRLRREGGFTLVELAICLMIIGLLVGGIIRGQEVLENARIITLIKQVNGYKAANIAFMDAYDMRPGDISNATNRIPGCNPGASCLNGDGNGEVGIRIESFVNNENQAGTAVPQVETSMFWKHLTLAGFISGLNAAGDPANPAWGETHPMAHLAGGFTVMFYMGINSGNFVHDKGAGHMLRLQANPTAVGWGGQNGGRDLLTAGQARKLDEKMDDGLGDSGYVTADHEDTCDGAGGGAYFTDWRLSFHGCIMYFDIN
jgi:prepilin-type N-terminal cleavage/methylation domain-containing protein